MLAMGLFGVGEILRNLEDRTRKHVDRQPRSAGCWPSRNEMRRSCGPALRGTALGSMLGILPG